MTINKLLSNLRYDLPAGLVVYLVALPLCLGIALASTGRTDLMISGIIAGVVGGIVVGALSGSRLGVSGPAAGLVVIVYTAIKEIGSWEGFLLAVVLAGAIQIMAGFLKAGIIAYYFPSTVIKGMLAAIGLLLIFKQIPLILGWESELSDNAVGNFSGALFSINDLKVFLGLINRGALIIGTITLLILFLFELPVVKRISFIKYFPAALMAVLTAILINQLWLQFLPELALDKSLLVNLPSTSTAKEFMQHIYFPDFRYWNNPVVYKVAFLIALIASLESLLSAEATDKLDPQKRITPVNRELKAQGIGNLIAGFIGGLPITQVVVRSSANITFNAKTKMSAIFHGFFLLVSVYFIPDIINKIPMSALAGILIFVGYKLTNVALYKTMFGLGWQQFVIFIGTIIAILLTDLLQGILIGMVLSLYFILNRNYRNSHNIEITKNKQLHKVKLVLSEETTFLNKASIQRTLKEIPENTNVIIDGSHAKYIDLDVLEIIDDYVKFTSKSKNITVQLLGIDLSKFAKESS